MHLSMPKMLIRYTCTACAWEASGAVCGKFRKISPPAAPLANYSLKFTENSGYWDTPTVGVHVCRAGGELLILFRVIKVARGPNLSHGCSVGLGVSCLDFHALRLRRGNEQYCIHTGSLQSDFYYRNPCSGLGSFPLVSKRSGCGRS